MQNKVRFFISINTKVYRFDSFKEISDFYFNNSRKFKSVEPWTEEEVQAQKDYIETIL